MIPYQAPLQDMRFVLDEVVGLGRNATLPGVEAVSPDLVGALLHEAGRFAAGVLAPLNQTGDQEGSSLENGVVRTPEGFRSAYRRYVEGGWNGLCFPPEHGGAGLPRALAVAVQEMWHSANMAFALCPLLTQAAVELLAAHGTPDQQRLYLPKLVSGEWTGTMNLTEPQAGSDLGAIRTRAVPDGDRYRIVGHKIYITYGDHDLADNVVHLVLARTPDAPPGSKGISLFVVPKLLLNADGSLGLRNDLRCVSLEHKLGIRASPTAVMAYGDGGGAVGFLVGEENRGLECMFTMMNNARLAVGLEGVAIAERAYQQAASFARERRQGRAVADDGRDDQPAAIVRHPDVRRMLMTMRASTEAARALVYATAAALDVAAHHPDPAEAERARARVDLLTPVVKAWSTDLGCEVASLGIQVHGGMGFIEETGAAQHLRDARIAPIYEGTNGIQANDLVFRKLARDHGAAAGQFIAECRAVAAALGNGPGDDVTAIASALHAATDALAAATACMVDRAAADPPAAAAAAAPYLRLFGLVAGGAMMAQAARAASTRAGAAGAGGADGRFRAAKLVTARFYAGQILPAVHGLLPIIAAGQGATLALADDAF